MNASENHVVMTKSHLSSTALAIVTLVAGTLAAAACQPTDPCGGEGVPTADRMGCVANAPSTDAAGDVEASDAGGDAAPASETEFGKACAAMADCPASAPICGAPQVPYCTQIYCKAGEANAGVCPAGFTCTDTPVASVCLKQ